MIQSSQEMLKYSSAEPGADDLKTALDCMLTVIKYVNDTMHQVAITGFEVCINSSRAPSVGLVIKTQEDMVGPSKLDWTCLSPQG